MAGINSVILCGRMVATPELKQTTGGTSVTTFTIACDRRQDGENIADFIDLVAWKERADFICKFFKKGDPILVRGSLNKRQWKDKQGNNRSTVEVIVNEVSFVPGIPKPSEKTESYNPYDTEPAGMVEIDTDEGLPF